ncbi:GDP-mannose transporter into the lumen of the Golgi [Borealophlyctis nickersoniae]|nr:GDP-mannose transporter into the lumen of the Golgi [Borealophlyctis nickersoniae]
MYLKPKSANAGMAILAYCFSSILMTVTNKLVLSSYDFRMNFLLLAIQSLVCVLMIQGFAKLGLVVHRPLNKPDAIKWFPVSLALVAMIYTGSKALQYLSIPLFTIFKNITIMVIAYLERYHLSGSPVTPMMLISFVLMVLSSFIGGWADLTSPTPAASGVSNGYALTGYMWMFANCATTAFYAVAMKKKIGEVSFQDFDTVYFNNILSVPVLATLSLLLEHREISKLSYQYFPNLPSAAENMAARQAFIGLAVAIAVSSVCSFAIGYSTSWCVRVTSSTTYSMVGSLNKLPIAVAGMLFFDDAVTFAGVLAVLIAFAAGILYSHAKSTLQRSTLFPTHSSSSLPHKYSIPPLTSIRLSTDSNDTFRTYNYNHHHQTAAGAEREVSVLFDAKAGEGETPVAVPQVQVQGRGYENGDESKYYGDGVKSG